MMDVVVGSHRRRAETTSSPDRAKICRLKQKEAGGVTRKVQVVYYLSRNGLLEHPHFMETTLSSANQPLRLKHVFDRLMALRGSGMPSRYSWSSKRNYKSGYVWCDLALMDIILPSEEGEYVLKGSELVVGGGCSERFQQHVSNQHQQNYTTRKSGRGEHNINKEEYEEEEEEELEYRCDDGEEKASYNTSSSTTTPHSRGVSSTDDEVLLVQQQQQQQQQKEVGVTKTNHRAITSSLAEKLNERERVKLNSNYPKRFGNGVGQSSSSMTPAPSRYSLLLQLIACGSSQQQQQQQQLEGERDRSRLSNAVGGAISKRRESVDPYDDAIEIENRMKKRVPEEKTRMVGNLQYCEVEKEYFSGSLVESMKANQRGDPIGDQTVLHHLKRSNSYNEQRSRMGMMEEEEVKPKEIQKATKGGGGGGVKDKCIPLKKSSKDRH